MTGLLVRGAADPEGLGARIRSQATLTGWHGSSDYGVALAEFTERYGGAVGPRTTVFVLGDARTNGADPNLPALRRLAEQARRLLVGPRAAFPLGHGRLRRAGLRRAGRDVRVPHGSAARRAGRPTAAGVSDEDGTRS
ncbi:hypothetical protein GCM10027072_66690 [Streptomyces bullii]